MNYEEQDLTVANQEEVIDVNHDNLIVIPKETMPPAIQNQINVLQVPGHELVKEEDLEFLQKHAPEFQHRFVTRSFFRSMFEFRHGVLSQEEHPTPDSAYWQSIGEQAVHVEELINLSFASKKLVAEMESISASIEELEYQLSLPIEHDFTRRKLEAKLAKKKVELEEKNYHITLQRKTAKERMREIKNSQVVIEELIPQLKHGTEDFEAHHAERYFKRYEKRMERINLLDPENKEHVVSHFLSFAKAPENRELTQQFVERHSNDQVGAAVGLIALQDKPKLENKPIEVELPHSKDWQIMMGEKKSSNSKDTDCKLPPPMANQIDFESKDKMMEEDPVTKKFFSRKVHKILVATPHRVQEDKNVTNFHMLQTPAAFDVSLEQPFGFSVPDARNFCIQKALDEDVDYIFFVDDDLLIPRNALVQLLHHFPSDYSNDSVAMVGGFYYRKYFPIESVGMHEDKEGQPCRIENYNIGDVIHNTLVLPSGCTLIKTSIFKKMEAPWYRSYTVANRPTITEDTYLCQKVRDFELGDIITDTGVQCVHVNKEKGILFGHPSIVDTKRNTVYENYREYFAI